MKNFLLAYIFSLAYLCSHAQLGNSKKGNRPDVTTPKDNGGVIKNDNSSRQQLPSAITGRYEYSKMLVDSSVITEILNMNNGGQLLEKVSKDAGSRTIDRTSLSSLTRKIIKPKSAKTSRSQIEDAWSDCTTQEAYLTVGNIGDFTVDYSSQAAMIYPGAMFSAKKFYSGDWTDINYGRNPITIITTVKNTGKGKPSKYIKNPNRANISDAVNELYNSFATEEKKISAEQFSFKLYEVENEASYALKVGASGNYMGVNAASMFSSSDLNKYQYILIDATKIMFNINVMPDQVGLVPNPTPDLMYIKQVNYGARILAVAKIQRYSSQTKAAASLSAQYLIAGGSFDINSLSSQLNNITEINYYVVGGRSNAIKTVYSINDLKTACAQIMETMNYNVAQPISYTLYNMNDKQVKKHSATDYFITQSCDYTEIDKPVVAKDAGVILQIGRMSTPPNNSDAELYGEIWVQAFDKDGKEIFPAKGSSDRLFSVKSEAHLKAEQLNQGMYTPGKKVEFIFPAGTIKAARLKIFYWLYDYNTVGGDNYLFMQQGSQQRPSRDNNLHFVSEVWLDKVSSGLNSNYVIGDFTAKGEGVFTVTVNITKEQKN